MPRRAIDEQVLAEAPGLSRWFGGAVVVLGLAASCLWCLFLLWLAYSAASWMLS